MCGICGYIADRPEKEEVLIRMNKTLAHRGPDDHGEETYATAGGRYVGFAQRRLSILDLSANGHQPMHSADKRVSVIFNGEIYNFRELKKEIGDYVYCSECDTEVLLAAYLKWGIDFVDKINGMFAIALLDRKDDVVYLIRDRIGKKPLYYYRDEFQNIVFASELKAIRQSTFFRQEINQEVIGRFLYRLYISAPDTIYKNTYKLEAGTVLKITGHGIEKFKYWDVAEQYKKQQQEQVKDYEEAKMELKNLLQKSISRRMIADVPIGAFLSGGYDSSLICALAQELLDRPLKTFSIGFYDEKYNEAPYAKVVSDILGTEHTELYIAEKDLLDMLDSIPRYYDEPFADSSQIPTMIVSRLAKEQVSVVLSGDGGDELFGGYNIYTVLQAAYRKRYFGRMLFAFGKLPYVKETAWWKQRSLLERIISDDNVPEARTQAGINHFREVINTLLPNMRNNLYYEMESRYPGKRYDIVRMLLDMDTYLPEDILTKVDRASMRYALECRCPFLDKEVMEYSFRLLVSHKNDSGNQKRILKDIIYGYIPKEVMERPKQGFSIPLDNWLRTVLKERVMDWTDKDYLIRQGIFDAEETGRFIQRYMEQGDRGKGSGQNFSLLVWSYFIFQQWYAEYHHC